MHKLIAILMLVCWHSIGATYYVDYSAGVDANNGTTSGTAWKHCPGDTNATGNALSTTLAAGDSVQFKGGIVYSNYLPVAVSGTVASKITYDGNSSGGWGTGKAVIDLNYFTNAACIVLNSNVANVRVLGFELRSAGGYAENSAIVSNAAAGVYGNSTNAIHDPVYGCGVDMSAGRNTNVYLGDLYFHNIGIWYSSTGWDGRALSGNGILADSPNNLTVTNCEFTKIGGTAIGIYAATNTGPVLITDCYMHDHIPVWTIDLAPTVSGVTFTNISITKTRLINVWGQWTGTPDDPGGTGTTEPHQNYIFVRANGVLSYWDVTISRCLFMETNATMIGSGGTATIHANNGASFNAWNNVFVRPWSYNGVFYLNASPTTGMTQYVRIYNNTVQRGTGGLIDSFGDGLGRRHLYVANNLITDSTNIQANAVRVNCSVGALPDLLDYNVYWHPSYGTNENYIALFGDYVGAKLFPQLQPLGMETHGLYADPLFVDAINATVASRDYRVTASSPAIGAGTNLSAYFTTDYSGNARPASGAWTIGAYQNPATGGKVTIPGKLTVVGKVTL